MHAHELNNSKRLVALGATSSAAVVGVVAKGTKLRLVGRKRGWVEVTNPATSQTGWIYGPNVDPLR